MRTFDEIAKEVGYDLKAQCPHQLKKKYYGYKGGVAKIFDTMTGARSFSSNTEVVVDPETEKLCKEWYDNQILLETKAANLWKKELREEYTKINTKIFDICYDNAYDRYHSNGYDEVANGLEEYISFAKDILSSQHEA